MKEGITATGFKFSISEDIADNWELLEEIADMEENKLKLIKVIKMILGEAGYNSLKEHCRENGVVSTKKMRNEVVEIFKMFKELKNSLPSAE
nr:MAG TPA: hypothetical protein [Caudoviricetes sp.]